MDLDRIDLASNLHFFKNCPAARDAGEPLPGPAPAASPPPIPARALAEEAAEAEVDGWATEESWGGGMGSMTHDVLARYRTDLLCDNVRTWDVVGPMTNVAHATQWG